MPIVRAIRKYGKENFKVEILQECSSLEEMNTGELRWAKELNTFAPNGYNLKAGGGSGSMSQLVRNKIGDSNRGKKRTVDQRINVSNAHKGLKVPEKSRAAFALQHPKKGTGPGSLAQRNSSDRLTYRFLDPSGREIKFTNLKAFCRFLRLPYGQFVKLTHGEIVQSRGYKFVSVVQTRFLRLPQ